MQPFHAPILLGIASMLTYVEAIARSSYWLPEALQSALPVAELKSAFDQMKAGATLEAGRLVREKLKAADTGLTHLSLSGSFRQKFRRLQAEAERAFDGRRVEILSNECVMDIWAELEEQLFFYVDPRNRELYEQTAPFGDRVLQSFQDASRDITAAARCLALDEWTASVFHSMRVLEHGLRVLASRVALNPDLMAHENWKNVIDQIEKRIREVEAEPRSPEKTETLRVYSRAAMQFRYFKDAWRNHVSHSHAHYDRPEAESVWNHVKEFMQQLANVDNPLPPS